MMFPCPVCGRQESHSHKGVVEDKRLLILNVDALESEVRRLRAREKRLVEAMRSAAHDPECPSTVAVSLLAAIAEEDPK